MVKHECVKLLSEIIAKQPRNTDAFNSRGLAYAKLKQFEKAIQDYNQAIELDPEYTYLGCLAIISDSNLTHSS
jgi:Flp pilus assembly protein TadD